MCNWVPMLYSGEKNNKINKIKSEKKPHTQGHRDLQTVSQSEMIQWGIIQPRNTRKFYHLKQHVWKLKALYWVK